MHNHNLPKAEKIEGVDFVVSGNHVILRCLKYGNGRLAIIAECDDGEDYGTLTVNLPDYPLEEGEILVKAWSENEELAAAAMATGRFEDTGKRVPTGFVQAQIWRIK